MALKLGDKINPPDPQPKPELVKKEAKKTPVVSNMKTILDAIRKDKGEKVVVKGNAIPPVLRQPTGIFELDFHLGGGFPRGRYSIVYGPESSCKTNIALLAVAQAQKRSEGCNKAVWVDVEQTFDPLWASKLGVDVESLLVVKPAYGEEAVDLIDALMRAEDLAILVVDSLAALISSAEIAKSTEKFDVGTSAMLIKRMVNKMMVAFGEESKKGHDPCVILINQIRFKPGVMFGDPETMPGGEAQKFLSSLRIRTYGKNEIDKSTNTSLFKEVNVVVKKSKVPIRAMSFSFKLCMIAHDGLKVGDTNSFNLVKSYLQSLEMLVKHPKGYVIDGINEFCPSCEGAGEVKGKKCGMCSGTKVISKLYPTLSAIQDQYIEDSDFCLTLQTKINDAMTEMMLVEEKEPSVVEAETGEAVDLNAPDSQ